MNLGELIVAVDRRTGVSYDPVAATEALNEALQTISTERPWPWLQDDWRPVMVNGRSTYSPPYGTTSISSVSINGAPLNRAQVSVLDGDSSWYGWTVDGEKLVLSPGPNGGETVVVRTTKRETPLVRNTDSPLLPEEWHQQVLVNLAAAVILERIDEFERADRRMKAYEAALRRMKHNARRARGPIAPKVRPGGGI